MEADDIQIGGDHYKAEYQHWNWVDDIGLHYYLGNATKYVTRWQKKNGAQDLRKALHYVSKAEERGVYTRLNGKDLCMTENFIKQLDSFSGEAIWSILHGEYSVFQVFVSSKISELELQEKK